MLKTLWTTILLKPFYNLLIVFAGVFWGNAGLAIVALTIVVKIVLFPLSTRSIKSQINMKRLEPELNRIKKEFPDKQIQAQKTFALYKENKINPFSGCLLILVQLPVIFALYWAIHDFAPTPSTELLYSAVQLPATLNTHFLGMDVTGKSLVLAILVAIVQYFQLALSARKPKNAMNAIEVPKEENKQADMAQMMQKQMKYTLPLMIGFFTYGLPAAIGLYWLVNILVTIAQEYYIRTRYGKTSPRTN